ncbi:DUF1552 domain-containing protein [Gemmatimonas sp. UBA7669]|jgi:hypothetical protein|uniref:DUF1552 domain-containing protein n=1 Tax=Gemmatimonas sp. UBA7669 TaxID=1946568 RepID=UPI0025BA3F97|nr:DUF1552 domain-containing protein [Gemmatimonas sp. UBA7669]
MQFLSGKAMPRRRFLQGMSATIALPYLDAMIPVGRRGGFDAKQAPRLVAIEMVHGAAGCNEWGAKNYLWSPEAVGKQYDLSPTALTSLDQYRDYLTIISNTDVREAEPTSPNEIGGDHFRSSAVFLTHMHPKQTEGSDVRVGTSLDQMYAQKFGQETPIPSMQLCIENVDQAGGCAYGYACVYTDSISWASPNEPLPVIRDPRVAFEKLFGVGGTSAERAERRRTRRSILDFVASEMSSLTAALGPEDRIRLDRYMTDIREVERRIQRVEARNTSGEVRELPEAPAGVPDSFAEHVKLMFDIQALAFAADITRVFSFKMGRDGSSRTYPESGTDKPFHPASHHGGTERGVKDFQMINKYHVSMLPYFLDKLKSIQEGESNMLDKTMIIYGSPMGDSNLHNHRRCPLIVLGKAENRLTGNLHIKAPDGTPMANAMLSMMHTLGLENMTSFGDSTGVLNLNSANA